MWQYFTLDDSDELPEDEGLAGNTISRKLNEIKAKQSVMLEYKEDNSGSLQFCAFIIKI